MLVLILFRQFIEDIVLIFNLMENIIFSAYKNVSNLFLILDHKWERTSNHVHMYQYYKWTEQVEKYRYKIK